MQVIKMINDQQDIPFNTFERFKIINIKKLVSHLF